MPSSNHLIETLCGSNEVFLISHRRAVPVQALGLFGPEAVRVVDRARVHLLVLGVVDVGALLPLGRDVVDLLGHFLSPRARILQAAPYNLFSLPPIMRRCVDLRQDGQRSTLVRDRPSRAASGGRTRRNRHGTHVPAGVRRFRRDVRHGRAGAELSGPPDPARGVVSARRRGRHRCPPAGAAAVRAARPAGGGREPSRRQRQYLGRGGRQGAARRLHAAARTERTVRHQSAPLRPDVDRSAQGPGAGCQRAAQHSAADREPETHRDRQLPRLHRRGARGQSRRCSTARSATAASITWRWRC